MVKLTVNQLELVKVVHANPGIKFRELYILAGYNGKPGSACSETAKTLVDRDILRRTGSKRSYQFYVADGFDIGSVITYELAPGMKQPDESDPLIEEALAITLTDEEFLYLKNHHKQVPRRKLAERLGLSKLALNLVLIKHNLETKSREAI